MISFTQLECSSLDFFLWHHCADVPTQMVLQSLVQILESLFGKVKVDIFVPLRDAH